MKDLSPSNKNEENSNFVKKIKKSKKKKSKKHEYLGQGNNQNKVNSNELALFVSEVQNNVEAENTSKKGKKQLRDNNIEKLCAKKNSDNVKSQHLEVQKNSDDFTKNDISTKKRKKGKKKLGEKNDKAVITNGETVSNHTDIPPIEKEICEKDLDGTIKNSSYVQLKAKKNKRKKQSKSPSDCTILQLQDATGTKKEKKKKKKKGENSENIALDHSSVEQTDAISKKGKKLRKNKQPETVSSENSSDANSLTICSPKISKLSGDNLNREIDNVNTNDIPVDLPVKKKKKKIKSHQPDETSVSNVTDLLPQEMKTKKKKKRKNIQTASSENESACKRQKLEADDSTDGNNVHQELKNNKTEHDKLGQWKTAKLSSSAQQDKFVRLLGGAKSKSSSTNSGRQNNGESVLSRLSGVWKPPQGKTLWSALQKDKRKDFSTMALDEKGSEKLATNLENQYNQTLSFNLQKRKEGNAAKGLGFQEDPAKGKKHYIDIHKVKSVALD